MRWLFAATWVIMIGTPAIALEWNTRTLAAKRAAIWGKLNMQDKATNRGIGNENRKRVVGGVTIRTIGIYIATDLLLRTYC